MCGMPWTWMRAVGPTLRGPASMWRRLLKSVVLARAAELGAGEGGVGAPTGDPVVTAASGAASGEVSPGGSAGAARAGVAERTESESEKASVRRSVTRLANAKWGRTSRA